MNSAFGRGERHEPEPSSYPEKSGLNAVNGAHCKPAGYPEIHRIAGHFDAGRQSWRHTARPQQTPPQIDQSRRYGQSERHRHLECHQ